MTRRDQQTMAQNMPGAARILGYAGLLPQVGATAVLIAGPPAWKAPAETLAFVYAALILSFLGGLWWGLAARAPRPAGWMFAAAVMPSLIAFAAATPWIVAIPARNIALAVIGVTILLSPVVDRRFCAAALAPGWWMRVRVPLSVGLGTLTVLSALIR